LGAIDKELRAAQHEGMIRSIAKTVVVLVTFLGIATSGWACGLTGGGSKEFGPAEMTSHAAAMPMAGGMMDDCHKADTAKRDVAVPCVALCAVTVTVAPALTPALAVQVGVPHYPASRLFQDWQIQPEPYPPRA
jgi:hypothetical protein